ncbi:ACD11 homolog protein [Nymphaea colorata]|nr:ACD11 homolog protein [Nymphaea colorata]
MCLRRCVHGVWRWFSLATLFQNSPHDRIFLRPLKFPASPSSFSSKNVSETGRATMGAQSDLNGTPLTPLSAIAEALERLAKSLDSGPRGDLRLSSFAEACSHLSVLFGCLGVAFKFAEIDFVAKVHDLLEASKTFGSLKDVLDHDIRHGTVKKAGSHSRNLRRVRQGLDLIRVLFEQFLSSKGSSLKDPASRAYAQVCAPFHSWAVRKTVAAGMYALPTREQLLVKLNETEYSVVKKMKRYIDASEPIIRHVDKLFISKNISLDW